MAVLKDKLENALNESRILILGAQVLIGFGFNTVFQRGFPKLPHSLQEIKLFSLGLMIIALGLLISPVAYHRIVARGELDPALHNFTQNVIEFALFPFALAMGIDVFVVSSKILPSSYGWIFGVLATAVALYFWYGLEYLSRRHQAETKMPNQSEGGQERPVELKDKIKEALIEGRMVLPGAQALLGFQFIVVLVDAFDQLPQPLKYVHLWSLLSIAVCTVLLITPAAYHRIVYQGEDSEKFLRLAGRFVIAAMVPLALGLAGDLLVVTWLVTRSAPVALATSAVALILLLGFWFGYMWWLRLSRQTETASRKKSVDTRTAA